MRYLLLLLLVGCSGAIHAENDLFSPTGKKSDSFFTHGTKLSYFPETGDENKKETYSVGQNIFTPSDTHKDAPQSSLNNSRPYTGWLYLEYRNSTYRSESFKDTIGLQIGCSGPCSGAKQTQQQTHRILDQRVPYWNADYTLRNEWGVIGTAERNYLLLVGKHYEVSTYGAMKVGNIIDNAALGFDVRIGYNFDHFASEPIIFKIPRKTVSPWMSYLFARVEQRVVLYNQLLEGSMFHDDPHTVTTEPLVSEADLGFSIGYKNYKFTYRWSIFSKEWKNQDEAFQFGGLDISW